jgi:hypothetical protein
VEKKGERSFLKIQRKGCDKTFHLSVHLFNDDLSFELLLFYFSHALSLPSKLCVSSTMVPQPRIYLFSEIYVLQHSQKTGKAAIFARQAASGLFYTCTCIIYVHNPQRNFLPPPPYMRENREGGYTVPNAGAQFWSL